MNSPEKNSIHAISPYTIRCFNKAMRQDENNKYFTLNSIAGKDLFSVVREFIEIHSTTLIKNEDDKRAYKFENVTYDDSRREIYGWMKHGLYGVGTDIIDIENGKRVFDKQEKNAEMINYYFHLFLPHGKNEGICIMHSYRGDGIKTIFWNELNNFFRRKVHAELTLSVKNLSYDHALKDWMEATAKEIRVVSYKGVKDKADKIRGFGHTEATLILKPEKKGLNLGRFKDYFIKNSPQMLAVEMLEQEGSQVKTVVELGGRKRVFRVGTNDANPICQIDIDESVKLVKGMPELQSMTKWVSCIISEFSEKMYHSKSVYHELKN